MPSNIYIFESNIKEKHLQGPEVNVPKINCTKWVVHTIYLLHMTLCFSYKYLVYHVMTDSCGLYMYIFYLKIKNPPIASGISVLSLSTQR